MPLPSLPEGLKYIFVSKIKPNKSQVGMLPELVDASLRRKREEERAQVFTSWTKCCQHLESSDEPPVLVDQEPTEEEEGVKLKSNCCRSHPTLSLLAGRSYWRRYICANIVINPLITRDPMVASIVFSCLPSLSHWLIW